MHALRVSEPEPIHWHDRPDNVIPLRAPGREAPEPVRAAMWRLLTGVLEVLDGRRAPAQLNDVLTAEVRRALITWRGIGGRRRLRSMHTCRADDAVEVCGTVQITSGRADRWQALAARAKPADPGWRLVYLGFL